MKRILFIAFTILLFTACEEPLFQKDSKSYMTFTANDVKYSLDLLTVQYSDSSSSVLRNYSLISCYKSASTYKKDSFMYLKTELPTVVFQFPDKKTGSWTLSDSIFCGIQLEENKTFNHFMNEDNGSVFNLSVNEYGTLGGYCSGTFSGKLKNDSGDELNIENGVFKIKIQKSYLNY